MGAVVLKKKKRKTAYFRLSSDLLKILKIKAARAKITLNNYVENVLFDIAYDEPNEVTKAAIEEVRTGKNPEKVYTDVDEMFNDILTK